MLASLCGTPGTGKTTVGGELVRSGYQVQSVSDLVELFGLGGEIEASSGSVLVDEDDLRSCLFEWARGLPGSIVLEGHLSYLAPSDLCLVLRLDPNVLTTRLWSRGYPEGKVRENAEAEGVGTLSAWAMDEEASRLGGRGWEDLVPGSGTVLEKDVTGETAAAIAGWARSMMDAYLEKALNRMRPYRPGKVDWLGVLSGWY